MEKETLKELGQFAAKIVSEASEMLMAMREEWMKIEEKAGPSDLVTMADKEIEKFLATKIHTRYPDHGIVGEEGANSGGSDTVWIIDPIDGTTNFIHNFPFYGISVGVVHKGEGLVGVVSNPMTKELFYGEKGFGAFVNGKRLGLNSTMELGEALVSTTMIWDKGGFGTTIHPGLVEIYRRVRGVRMVGGAAISLCEIAKGTLNAYIIPSLAAWDYAGGKIILEEAGGVVTQFNGSELSFDSGGSLVGAHPSLHQEIVAIISNQK